MYYINTQKQTLGIVVLSDLRLVYSYKPILHCLIHVDYWVLIYVCFRVSKYDSFYLYFFLFK